MHFIVPNELDGITVKNFLRRHCSVSARMLTRLKQTEGGITVSGKSLRSIDILRAGDIVELILPEDQVWIEPEPVEVRVMYEDENAVVFDKPAGMLVHPVGAYTSGTLAGAAAYHAQSLGEKYIFRPVNRLDKDTSGLLLTAKNSLAAYYLSSHCSKKYTALCEGRLTGSGTIDSPLRICEGHSIQREASDDGVSAVTHYTVLENYGNEYSLLLLWLETGRTHQIRAHMASVGHPLAGDDMYGGSREHFRRQCLHCCEMTFTCPGSGADVIVSSPMDFFLEKI